MPYRLDYRFRFPAGYEGLESFLNTMQDEFGFHAVEFEEQQDWIDGDVLGRKPFPGLKTFHLRLSSGGGPDFFERLGELRGAMQIARIVRAHPEIMEMVDMERAMEALAGNENL